MTTFFFLIIFSNFKSFFKKNLIKNNDRINVKSRQSLLGNDNNINPFLFKILLHFFIISLGFQSTL